MTLIEYKGKLENEIYELKNYLKHQRNYNTREKIENTIKGYTKKLEFVKTLIIEDRKEESYENKI